MGINDGDSDGDQPDRHDCVDDSPTESPRKTCDVSYPLVDADSDSWTTLSDAQQRSKSNAKVDFDSNESPLTRLDVAAGCRVPALDQSDYQKMNKLDNLKYPCKPYNRRNSRTVSKQWPNGESPFSLPAPLPHHPTTFTHFFPRMIHSPPIYASGYSYQFPRGSFSIHDTQFTNSDSDIPARDFIPQVNGGFQPFPYTHLSHYSNFVGRNPWAKEISGQIYPSWNNQPSVASCNNLHWQENMWQRPPFSGSSDFFDKPCIPGPSGSTCYFPFALPGSVNVPYSPYLVPNSPAHGVSVLPVPTVDLRARIVKQIEYYFSDQNLLGDHYLISLMNDQGWIPISRIAEFPRIKRMNTEIPFILDALKASETIEVQAGLSAFSEHVSDKRIRRRNEWSKWIPASAISKCLHTSSNVVKNDGLNEDKKGISEVAKELPSPNGSSVDGLLLNKESEQASIVVDEKQKFMVKDTKEDEDSPLASGEFQKITLENSNSNMGLDFPANTGNNCTMLRNDTKLPVISRLAGPLMSINIECCEKGNILVPSNLYGSSNDFSSTLKLDEEQDPGQNITRDCSACTMERPMDQFRGGHDDEVVFSDLSIERLVIATQNH